MRSAVLTIAMLLVFTQMRASGEGPERQSFAMHRDGVSGQLVVQSWQPGKRLVFDLTVVQGPSAHNGELRHRVARCDDDTQTALYRPANDCTVAFLFDPPQRPERITIIQHGTCDSQGFGAFVNGSGVYERQPEKPTAN
jgi:hypothetical protein